MIVVPPVTPETEQPAEVPLKVTSVAFNATEGAKLRVKLKLMKSVLFIAFALMEEKVTVGALLIVTESEGPAPRSGFPALSVDRPPATEIVIAPEATLHPLTVTSGVRVALSETNATQSALSPLIVILLFTNPEGTSS